VIHAIRLYGDPSLRRPGSRVTTFDDELRSLAAEMVETMLDADGAGLAAPQIGVPLRLFVMSGFVGEPPDPDAPRSRADEREAAEVVVNPQLVDPVGSRTAVEGCLSLPGLYHEAVPRFERAVLRYQDLEGRTLEREVDDHVAVVVQHEHDHLDGVLYVDRLPDGERRAFMEEHRSELAEMQRRARAYLKELRSRGVRQRQ
jgi:peptide deformylase